MSDVLIRAATAADAPALQELAALAFADLAPEVPPSPAPQETVADVEADLRAAGGLLLTDAADPSRVLAGLRFFRHDKDSPRLLWIKRVSVHPAARRRGLARALVAAAVEPAAAQGYTALRLGVWAVQPEVAAVYTGIGYEVIVDHGDWWLFGHPLPRAVADVPAMHALGRSLAATLRPGDLVVLSGPLGAGKTTLVQGIGAGLGVHGPITSPTFVLAREHDGDRLPLLHVDAYRLASVDEVRALDLDTPAESAVTVVEWGAGLVEGLADGHLLVSMDRSDTEGEEVRSVTLSGRGSSWADRQNQLDTEV